MRVARWSVTFGLVGILVLGVASISQGRGERHEARGSSAAPDAFARGARWVRLHGRWIYGVPMTVGTGPLGIRPVRNRGSGLCMSSAPKKKGRAATQQRCNGSAAQQWILARNGTGFSLYNRGMYPHNTDYCLRNRGGRLSDGNHQIMWPCYASSQSPMHYVQGGAGTAGYVLLHTNGWKGQYCVTSRGSRRRGSPIEEWLCSKDAHNQQWKGVTAG